MPRPTTIERSAVSEAIRRLRNALGLTQQDLAVRLAMSAITIAKFETNKLPSPRTLRKLAELARKHYLHQEAHVLSDAADSASSAPQAQRHFLVSAAFYKFMNTAGPQRMTEMEKLLSPEMARLQTDLAQFSTAAAEIAPPASAAASALSGAGTVARMAHPERAHSLADLLAGTAWVCEDPKSRAHLSEHLTRAIAQLIDARGRHLASEEVIRLGELGRNAAKLHSEVEQRREQASGLSIPQSVRRLRERWGITIAHLAEQLQVPADLLAKIESGEAPPNRQVVLGIGMLLMARGDQSPESLAMAPAIYQHLTDDTHRVVEDLLNKTAQPASTAEYTDWPKLALHIQQELEHLTADNKAIRHWMERLGTQRETDTSSRDDQDAAAPPAERPS